MESEKFHEGFNTIPIYIIIMYILNERREDNSHVVGVVANIMQYYFTVKKAKAYKKELSSDDI